MRLDLQRISIFEIQEISIYVSAIGLWIVSPYNAIFVDDEGHSRKRDETKHALPDTV